MRIIDTKRAWNDLPERITVEFTRQELELVESAVFHDCGDWLNRACDKDRPQDGRDACHRIYKKITALYDGLHDCITGLKGS